MGERILLSHGEGGKRTRELIENVFLTRFSNPTLDPLFDSGILDEVEGKIAFTTDSYVVSPPFFPGGNIGKLAVCGTLNDLSVCGANPLALSCSLIIEEGLPLDDLSRIAESMMRTAKKEDVIIACGDTKVVERGKGDKVFITTSGIGSITSGWSPSPQRIGEGDRVILTGTMGDHGIAVLVARENLKLSSTISSDVASLKGLLIDLVEKFGDGIKFMRDPTRGGVGVTLNEISETISSSLILDETAFPLNPAVRGVCELLGFDPLYIANEGKALLIVEESIAEKVLSFLRKKELGKDASIIGQVEGEKGPLLAKTLIGGIRVVDYPSGEQLPRIC